MHYDSLQVDKKGGIAQEKQFIMSSKGNEYV